MARELLPPEEATSWEEFHDRYLREWSYRNSRGRSARSLLTGVVGMLLIVVAFVFTTYAAARHGQWSQWLGVALPLVIVAMMLTRAWKLGRRNGERMRELGRLEQEWQERLERGEIPRTRAEAGGTTP